MLEQLDQVLDGFHRTINVKVKADQGKQLQRVKSSFDGFDLADDYLQPAVANYANSFVKQDGIKLNTQRKVLVEAWHTDGTSDAGEKQWQEAL